MTKNENGFYIAQTGQQDFERSLIEAILEASPDGVLVVDASEFIIAHNRGLFDAFGIARDEFPQAPDGNLAGKPDHPLLTRVLDLVAHRDAFLQRVQELYADPRIEDSCEIDLKDGRTLERHSRALWGADATYLGRVWFFRDITERKQLERRLQELSHRDPLTGVANRRHLHERMEEELSRARRFGRELAFIMFDIDHFKEINDRCGHARGDAILKDLCRRAETILREEDVFARIGGEEFAILAPDTDHAGALALAERLREQVTQAESAPIRVSVSAGVAILRSDDVSPGSALERADQALLAAKRSGRDRVCPG